jgi:hypothetical protein
MASAHPLGLGALASQVRRSCGKGQSEGELRAHVWGADDVELRSLQFENLFGERQPQSRPSHLSVVRITASKEALAQTL